MTQKKKMEYNLKMLEEIIKDETERLTKAISSLSAEAAEKGKYMLDVLSDYKDMMHNAYLDNYVVDNDEEDN